MVVTREWLVENYNKYNNLIFNGGLPSLERGQNQWVNFDLKVNNSRVYLGQFCQRKRGFFGDMNYTIKISRYYDRDEKGLIDTLVHEMIHYYIMSNNLQDDSLHGTIFRKKMENVVEQMGKESAELRRHPLVNAYLDAELALCKMMQRICVKVAEGIDMDVPIA